MTNDAGHRKAPDEEIEYLNDGPAAPSGTTETGGTST